MAVTSGLDSNQEMEKQPVGFTTANSGLTDKDSKR